jgi:hypothetical protein
MSPPRPDVLSTPVEQTTVTDAVNVPAAIVVVTEAPLMVAVTLPPPVPIESAQTTVPSPGAEGVGVGGAGTYPVCADADSVGTAMKAPIVPVAETPRTNASRFAHISMVRSYPLARSGRVVP